MAYRKRTSAVFWGVRGAKSLESRANDLAGVIDTLAKRAEPYAGPADALEQDPKALREALETLRVQHEELMVADEELRAQLEEFHSLEETVQTERARLEQIFLQAPDAYVLTDDAGTVEECNLAATRLFGMDERYLCGKPLAVLIHKEDVTGFRNLMTTPKAEPTDAPLRVLSRTHRDPIQTAAIVTPSDDKRSFFWRFRVIRVERDEIVVPVSDSDVSAEQRAQHEEQERANLTKDRLIALVSHDMRAPLNAIIGWTELLRQSSIDEAMRNKALATIERNARAQAGLIEDLLDISRITLGRLRIELKPLELTALLRAAVDAVRPTAHARGLALTLTVPKEEIEVLGDPERLQQAIGNLLGNAIKFTPASGSIAMELKRAGQHALITVTDTGKGIDRAMLATIFDCFQQAPTNRQNEGLGLGLYIARQIAQLHLGTLDAQSDGDRRGAVFTLTLPIHEAEQRRSDESRPALPVSPWTKKSLANLNVLVVDDDADARELTGLVLRKAGASVLLASSVKAALDTFDTFDPDIVVSDIRMDEADGNDLVRALRQSKHADVPAIAISGNSADSDARRAIEAGFDAYLVKPIPVQALIDAVAKASALDRT